MLKKVVVTNYLGESMTYKITEGEMIYNKNKLPLTLENLKRLNTSGVWSDTVFVSLNSHGDIHYRVNLDENERVTSIDVFGLIPGDASWSENEVFNLVSDWTYNDGSQYTDLCLSGCMDGWRLGWWIYGSPHVGTIGLIQYGGEDEEFEIEASSGETYDFSFEINKYLAEEWGEDLHIETTIYPMVRLASEPAGFEPYDPHGGEEAEDTSGLLITSIDGLGPAKANINMTEISTSDGSIFNSARLTSRNIVIKALYTGESVSIEEARHKTYQFFPIKSKVKIKVVTDTRTVETEGYVESNEPDIFSKQSGCQISILCPSAYFSTGGDIERKLPASVRYIGEIPTGVEMEFSYNSTDITERSDISRIDIFKDATDHIGLDLTKMSNIVPNTMPVNTLYEHMAFVIDKNNEYKFLAEIPFHVDNGAIASFIMDGYLYILNVGVNMGDDYTSGDLCRLNKNGRIAKFDKIAHYNFPVRSSGEQYVRGACVFQNRLHFIYTTTDYRHTITHVTWCEDEGFTERPDSNSLNNIVPSSFLPKALVVYHDTLHCFGYTTVNSSHGRRHFVLLNNTTWVEDQGFSENEYGYPQMPDSLISVFDDKFHFVCDYGRHYSYDSQQGFVEEVSVPNSDGQDYNLSHGFSTVFNGTLHVFKGNSKEHYKLYPEDDEWIRLEDTPCKYYQNYLCGDLSDDDFIYVMGNMNLETTTIPPDNVHLERTDQLIINTIKGQKAISLIRDGTKYNILNVLERGSKWFEIKNGINEFTYSSEDDDKLVGILKASKELYEGV